MTKVSVIIPNYNRSNLISITIENMLSQTLVPWEVIVVDDGSTDDSVEVVRSFGSQVKLICQENQGPGAARNAGLALATGDYIQFLDSDDLCSLNKLEAQVRAMHESSCDIVYSPWAKVYINKHKIQFKSPVLQSNSLLPTLKLSNSFLRSWFIIFQTCLFRRSFLDKFAGYRTDLITREDGEFLFRMILQNPKICFTKECLTLYRIHDMPRLTDTGTKKESRIKDLAKFLYIVKSNYLASNVKIDFLTWLIFQSLIWNCLKDLYKIEEVPPHVIENLSIYNVRYLEPVFDFVNLCQRIEGHLRNRLTGSRYSRLYRTSHPTEHQYQLIRDLGFEPSY